MSTFQELMASLGIGAATATLKVVGEYQYRGSFAEVELTLHGGNAPQRVETVSISLTRTKQNGKYRSWDILERQVLDSQFYIAPGDRRFYITRIAVPEDAPLAGILTNSWMDVMAAVDIRMAVNPRDSVRLHPTFQREIFAVEDAMKRLGFTTIGTLGNAFLDSKVVVMKFDPKPEMRDQIDGIALHLQLDAASVHGVIKLNYREKSAKDLLKAIVGMNNQEIVISFPRTELLTQCGRLNPEGAVPTLQKVLADSLILPDNEAHWMLRASQVPIQYSEELMRPASDTGSTRPAELLRPRDDEAGKEEA